MIFSVNFEPLAMDADNACPILKPDPALGLVLGAQLGICREVLDLPSNFAVNLNYLKQYNMFKMGRTGPTELLSQVQRVCKVQVPLPL